MCGEPCSSRTVGQSLPKAQQPVQVERIAFEIRFARVDENESVRSASGLDINTLLA